MYTLFDDSLGIESANSIIDLQKSRSVYIEKLLQDGYEYATKNIKDDDDVIELIKDDEVKRISILYSSNITGTSKKFLGENKSKENNTEINNDNDINNDINNDNLTNNIEEENININDSDINNKIANKIMEILNSSDYQLSSLPTAYISRQIFNMLNKDEFIYYRNFIFKNILAGRCECIINIPFATNTDLTDTLAFCYMLILLNYKFEITNDEKQLSIHIIW